MAAVLLAAFSVLPANAVLTTPQSTTARSAGVDTAEDFTNFTRWGWQTVSLFDEQYAPLPLTP